MLPANRFFFLRSAAGVLFSVLAGLPLPAMAGGPGLGNLSYAAGEHFQQIFPVRRRQRGSPGPNGGYNVRIVSGDAGFEENSDGTRIYRARDVRHPDSLEALFLRIRAAVPAP